MKYKTCELTGAQLDAAVAKAEWPGREIEVSPHSDGTVICGVMDLDEPEYFGQFSPSAAWSVGGPIIERERIGLIARRGEWEAFLFDDTTRYYHIDDGMHTNYIATTPLIAAMRVYVASKFGDEIDL